MTAAITLAATAVVGAGVGIANAMSSSKTASTQQQASQTQLGMEQTQFGEQQQYATQLQNLISNPSSVETLPGYQFNFDQGSQAVSRNMAASGFLGAGNEGTALMQYGQNYAMNTFNQQAQLLSGLAGFNAPAYGSNSTGSANASTTANNSSFNQYGGVLASLGYSANTFAANGGFGGGGTPDPTISAGTPGSGSGAISGGMNAMFAGSGYQF